MFWKRPGFTRAAFPFAAGFWEAIYKRRGLSKIQCVSGKIAAGFTGGDTERRQNKPFGQSTEFDLFVSVFEIGISDFLAVSPGFV